MARLSMARSPSTSSTLSCITVGNNQFSTTSVASSATPPTSISDATSISPKDIEDPSTSAAKERRVLRVRMSTGGSKEGSLTDRAKRTCRRKSVDEGYQTVSGDTSVADEGKRQGQLVQDGIQVSDLDWKVDAMPGDIMKHAVKASDGTEKRRSTRLDMLETASSIIDKTKSVLGKRGQDALELGKEKLQVLNRRESLRSRQLSVEGPVKKKARVSTALDPMRAIPPTSKLNQKVPIAPRVKRWLSQGLYVGQDRDFDARLTETKNKLRKASTGPSRLPQRSVLPLPMFAGVRTLELGRDFRLPFNVFSPLPPGQPKPEEWRKTQKNVFVGDAAQVWRVNKNLEASTCICKSDSGCDDNCFNRFMFYECDDSNCDIGSELCTNRSFEGLRQRCKAGGKYNVGVEVIKTLDRGYGVRSNRTFEPNQIIVEYAGEIITQDECDDRMRNLYKHDKCYYLMSFDQNMIIDATRGSIARFVNHSCKPNCKMIKWTVAGKPRMALFAGEKGIMTGEELTYDYNFDPFSAKNIQECRCGTDSCRGVLGPKPKESSSKSKDVKDALKPLIGTSTKRKIQQTIEYSLQAVVSKKRKLAIPSPIKSAFNTATVRGSAQLAKARSLGSPGSKKAILNKKASERSLRESKRAQTVQVVGRSLKKHTAIIYTRPRSSRVPAANKTPEVRPISRRNSIRTAAASMRENAVRTVKGSDRPKVHEKTIRVIGNE